MKKTKRKNQGNHTRSFEGNQFAFVPLYTTHARKRILYNDFPVFTPVSAQTRLPWVYWSGISLRPVPGGACAATAELSHKACCAFTAYFRQGGR